MKKNVLKMRVLLPAVLLALSVLSVQAQVTIGSGVKPSEGALLDLKTENAATPGAATTTKGGLLFPRIELVNTTSLQPMIADSDPDIATLKLEHRGLTVYNLNATTGDFHSAGLYTWNGAKWVSGSGEQWFYMPANVLPTTTDSPDYVNQTGYQFEYDIYEVYADQFGMAGLGTTAASSEPATLSTYAANQLIYMVTYYDNTVFQNVSVTADGKLRYNVIAGATPTIATFMDIIFKVK